MDYACEYAKSSRASCKLCRAGINQGNLRLAIYVQVIINIIAAYLIFEFYYS